MPDDEKKAAAPSTTEHDLPAALIPCDCVAPDGEPGRECRACGGLV